MPLFKKEPKAPKKQFLFAGSIDYSEYNIPLVQVICVALVGFVAGFALGMIFYNNVIVGVVAGVVVGIAAIPVWRNMCIKRRTNQLRIQFRDMLESVATSLGAGLNVPDAFISAYSDMKTQYSEDAPIVRELSQIVNGMSNNFNIELLLADFAERSNLDDVRSFASVFDTALRRGGDIKQVVKSTYEIINDKMEVEMEIETMITSSKSELMMMMIMPVILVLLLRNMGGGLANFDSPTGIMATTIGVVCFVAAYIVGNKIMTIRL